MGYAESLSQSGRCPGTSYGGPYCRKVETTHRDYGGVQGTIVRRQLPKIKTLTAVQGVMPSLEQRRDGYADPGEDVRGIVSDLLAKLWSPPRRRFSDDREIESSSSPYVMDRRDSRCAPMLY